MRKLTMSELNRMDVEEYRNVEKLPIVIVLDNIRSLSNVGSFFRTADAFRIETLFLCGITACPPHREIHKTALGADDSVQWRYFKTTVEACECLIIVPQKSAYIFGNEVDGIDDALLPYCTQAVEIPQMGTKHSLNVSVCAGIVMYRIFASLHHLLS